MMEDLGIKDGHIMNSNMDTYMIPCSLDIPEIVPMGILRATTLQALSVLNL